MKRILLLLALCCTPSFGAIAFVNACAHDLNGGTGASDACTINATTGNILHVAFGSRADLIQAGITVTCADTAMNTYTALGQKASPGNLGNIFEFYAKNITGNAANVVTCTISSSTTNLNISVTQYSGIDTTSPIDATFASGAADSATTATTGNLSTATADTVLISGCQVYNFGAAYTADSGYTIPSGATSSNGWVTTQYKIVSATQTNVTVTCTITPSNNIQLGFTAFKIAASAAGYVANPTVIVVGP